jgi:ATPase subunit of ABC transporter with duplicated ATPase domains
MKVALNRQAARTKSAGKRAGHAGIPKIMMNLLEDKGEKTTAHLKRIHEKHIEEENNVVEEIKRKLPPERRMTIDFANNRLPNSKKIVTFDEVNLLLDGTKPLWKTNVSFSLIGNERLHLRGTNGSGKSSLLKLITGNLLPSTGKLYMGVSSPVLLDQDVSLLAADKSILENIIDHSRGLIPQHELRIRLARLLFYNDEVLKPVSVLSGGERMRAGLACLLASVEPPELILLDEPTNNLDLAGVLQMTKMLNSYSGPLIVVSHDKSFISDLQITREMELERDTYY